MNKTIKLLKDKYVICKINGTFNPELINDLKDSFLSYTKTPEEISLVIPEGEVEKLNESFEISKSWSGFYIDAKLDFNLLGVLYSISKILFESEISIFVISTFNTDYFFVQEHDLEKALQKLEYNGWKINFN
jgi:hypothetical protein